MKITDLNSFGAKMFRTPQKTMLHFYNFVVLLTAVTVALGSTLEGTSSYYLITRQASTADGLFQVYRALDEAGCMSLCNNKDGCLKGVYSHKSGSCFLEMIDGCNHGRAKKRDKDVISTGGNSVFFTKVYRENREYVCNV